MYQLLLIVGTFMTVELLAYVAVWVGVEHDARGEVTRDS